jgi:hypothetical protein
MMLDRSGSMVGFGLVRSAAEQFVGLLQADKARIGSFATGFSRPGDFTGAARSSRDPGTELQEPGPTPLWNAVNVGITSLLHQRPRVVLVFTDGVDHPMGSNNISYRDVEKIAEQEDVMFFAIGLASRQFGGRRGGRGPAIGPMIRLPPEEPKVDAGLPKIAAATGGGYFELTSTNNLGATFRRSGRASPAVCARHRRNGWQDVHKLEVRLKKPNLLRGRRTYIVTERYA